MNQRKLISNKTKGAFFLTTGIGLMFVGIWAASGWQVAAAVLGIFGCVALIVAGIVHLIKEDWM